MSLVFVNFDILDNSLKFYPVSKEFSVPLLKRSQLLLGFHLLIRILIGSIEILYKVILVVKLNIPIIYL